MVIEILFNNKILFIFEMNSYIYIKFMHIIERNLWTRFLFFHLDNLSIRYESSNFRLCECLNEVWPK